MTQDTAFIHFIRFAVWVRANMQAFDRRKTVEFVKRYLIACNQYRAYGIACLPAYSVSQWVFCTVRYEEAGKVQHRQHRSVSLYSLHTVSPTTMQKYLGLHKLPYTVVAFHLYEIIVVGTQCCPVEIEDWGSCFTVQRERVSWRVGGRVGGWRVERQCF